MNTIETMKVVGGVHLGKRGRYVTSRRELPEGRVEFQPLGTLDRHEVEERYLVPDTSEVIFRTPKDLDGDWIETYRDGRWACWHDGRLTARSTDQIERAGQTLQAGGWLLLEFRSDCAAAYALRMLRRHTVPPGAEPEAEKTGITMTKEENTEPDLKPRGVKRQWHLMPLDALNRVFEKCPGRRLVAAVELAEYQRAPGVDQAAYMVGALITRLKRVHDLNEAQAYDLVVQVFEHGAEKYDADNWRRAATDRDAFRREYLSAICRHVFADGLIDTDHTLPDGTEIKGSGLPHLAHAVCGGLMVLWHEMRTFA